MILHDLNKTNSRLDKEQILKTASEQDKMMFQFAYNPLVMYYLKFETNSIDYNTIKSLTLEDEVLLNRLAKREITGNCARGTVLNHCNANGDLVKLICNKDLACGVTATTLNKVFGKNFIPEFKVQLATDMPLEDIIFPKVCQIKYNGTRVITFIDEYKNIIFFTRNGLSFLFPKLADTIRDLPLRSMVLDGELCFGDSQGSDHTKVSGLVNSALKGTPINNPDLVYNTFDIMTLEEFISNTCPYSYDYRFKKLKELISPSKHINIAKTWVVESLEELNEQFEIALSKGYEGFILKDWSALYKFRRTKDWIKIKDERTVDLQCVSFKPGEGKYEGEIGALLCEGEVDGKQVSVLVGSGLSDYDRAISAFNYIGKKIEISYNTVIQDKKTGKWSLFLPRFVTIRGDL